MADKQDVNICWTTGNFHQRHQLINKIKEHVAKQSEGDYELSIYDNDVTYEYVRNQIIQTSVFDSHRLIILNDWPKAKTSGQSFYKEFLRTMKDAPSDVVVICNDLRTTAKKFKEDLKKIAVLYEYDDVVKVKDAPKWISSEISNRGKSIDKQDAQHIANSVGESDGKYGIDLDQLYCRIKKICDYVGNRKSIKHEDVVSVCSDDYEFIVWKFFDLLDDKKLIEAMQLLEHAHSTSKDTKSFAEGILMSVIWRFRLISILQEYSKQGLDTKDMIKNAMNVHKLSKEGQGRYIIHSVIRDNDGNPKPIYSDKMIEKCLNGYYRKPAVACYKRKEALGILMAAEQSLEKIRYGCTKNEVLILLDALVMQACNYIGFKDLEKVREPSN